MKKNYTYSIFTLFLALCLPMMGFSGSSDNEIDANGKRQGYWIITGKMTKLPGYAPESKVEEGEYKDNKKQGLWKKYWPNGNLNSEVSYKLGMPQGQYKVYYRNGKLQELGNWVNELNTGVFKRYYENGNIQQEFTYLETGLRNGIQKYYYENGQIELEAHFANGEENGTITVYNEDGSLKEKKEMTNGVLKDGSLKKYANKSTQKVRIDENAKSADKTNDKTNKAYEFDPNGYNTLYNRSLQKTQVGQFKGGRLWDGKWHRYGDDGILIAIEIYKEGKFVGTGVTDEE